MSQTFANIDGHGQVSQPMQNTLPVQTYQTLPSLVQSQASAFTSHVITPSSISLPFYSSQVCINSIPVQTYQLPVTTWHPQPFSGNYNYFGVGGGIHVNTLVGRYEMAKPTFQVIREH